MTVNLKIMRELQTHKFGVFATNHFFLATAPAIPQASSDPLQKESCTYSLTSTVHRPQPLLRSSSVLLQTFGFSFMVQ
jgi:hypothetical protein